VPTSRGRESSFPRALLVEMIGMARAELRQERREMREARATGADNQSGGWCWRRSYGAPAKPCATAAIGSLMYWS
jgi:hypothetical protein